jgi:antitoxin YefM
MSKQIPYRKACQDFGAVFDQVVSSREPVEVVRDGFQSISVIPTAELDSILETLYLFQSHENAARLLDALERAKAGTNTVKTVDELRREFGLAEEEKRSA